MIPDPTALDRFVLAQMNVFEDALAELQAGQKRSHWMWFIFPQLDGLGVSSAAKHYAIGSLDEARAYLAHPILGPRLLTCAEAVLRVQGRAADEILGTTDSLKLRSCATLFASVAPAGSVFERILARYYGGEPDLRTLALLSDPSSSRT